MSINIFIYNFIYFYFCSLNCSADKLKKLMGWFCLADDNILVEMFAFFSRTELTQIQLVCARFRRTIDQCFPTAPLLIFTLNIHINSEQVSGHTQQLPNYYQLSSLSLFFWLVWEIWAFILSPLLWYKVHFLRKICYFSDPNKLNIGFWTKGIIYVPMHFKLFIILLCSYRLDSSRISAQLWWKSLCYQFYFGYLVLIRSL